jgi:hypothetical protein
LLVILGGGINSSAEGTSFVMTFDILFGNRLNSIDDLERLPCES